MSLCLVLNIDPTSPTPLYAQVEATLAASIVDGTLAPGAQLPSEDGLIERYAVSRTTVRKALQNLTSRGLVETRRGKGNFVCSPKITQELTELCGFVEDMQALGRVPSARVLDQRLVAADDAVARQLGLAMGTFVVRFARVRLADGVPVSYDETYLPRELGEKVASHDLATEPIFALLEQKYDTPLIEAEYRLEATCADAFVAEALGIEAGSPIFKIERTSFAAGNRPIDYERLHYRGDSIRFATRLARRSGSIRADSVKAGSVKAGRVKAGSVK